MLHEKQNPTDTPPMANFTSLPSMSGITTCLSTYSHKSFDINNIHWIIDTGAPDHTICSTIFFFTKITAIVSYNVKLPNCQEVPVTHIGTVKLSTLITLENVLCVLFFHFQSLFDSYINQKCLLLFCFPFHYLFSAGPHVIDNDWIGWNEEWFISIPAYSSISYCPDMQIIQIFWYPTSALCL